MLQTLTDITDIEIDLLAKKSIDRITNVCTSKETMFDILGITPYNTQMTPFQKSIKLYPALLNDVYTKDTIREVKNSLLKKYRSGKLEINGKYTFILPDLYAACEHWFCNINKPQGLLEDKEVFCRLFKRSPKIDCLRSPHLYREHAIRFNVASDTLEEKSKSAQKWFSTDAIYTSTHDLISKLLQFDCDGDLSLVVSDENFIQIAEKNMIDVVPLYYNMQKAKPMELNNKNIYHGLNLAFTGGNIGIYSNAISKIWNSQVFVNGSIEERQKAIDCIKRLCCQNNFVIDYAKTLYKPEFPDYINKEITEYTKCKLPSFFQFAKDKETEQVDIRNDSLVNKLYSRIPNKEINTRGMELGEFNYQLLMSNPNIKCSSDVSNLYATLNKEYRYMINMKDEYIDNLRYVSSELRKKFSNIGYLDDTITDMLVDYLYGGKKRTKQLLWFLYGEAIFNNLSTHINMNKCKIIKCIDCGEWFETDARSMKKVRCNLCQKEYRKEWDRKRKQAKT